MTTTIAVAVVCVAVIIGWGRRSPGRAGRVFLVAAVASSVLVGLVVLRPAIEDGGAGFGAGLTATPVLICAMPTAVVRFSRSAGLALAWTSGLAMLMFAGVFGASLGLLYLPTAFLLLAAAVQLGRSPAEGTRPGPVAGNRGPP